MKFSAIDVVPWLGNDDRTIWEATIIGRARLTIEGGGIVHAIIVDTGDDFRAVYMNRETSTFETVKIGHAIPRSAGCPICGRTDTHQHGGNEP